MSISNVDATTVNLPSTATFIYASGTFADEGQAKSFEGICSAVTFSPSVLSQWCSSIWVRLGRAFGEAP